MPKINVYLSDELAEEVRLSGVPVSAICQRALEDAARRVTAIRGITLDQADLLDLPNFTDRAREAVRLAIQAARAARAPDVDTGHLLRGLLDEGGNLALRVLAALDISPDRVRQAIAPARSEGHASAFSSDAANALQLAVTEAVQLGHNYVGCEHLLLGLVAEPDGPGSAALRQVGAEPRAVRSAVSAALAGYVHLRAQTGGGDLSAGVIAAALKPLVERIEALEARLD